MSNLLIDLFMSETRISTNVVMNNKKSKDEGVLGVLLTNLVMLISWIFFVYACAIDPVFNPQNKELAVVCLISVTTLFFIKQLKGLVQK
jgi:hypothetical protein